MTKAELIERVYGGKHLPRELTKKTVAQIVDAVFTEMGDYFIRTRVSPQPGRAADLPGLRNVLEAPPSAAHGPQPADGRSDHDPAAGDDHVLARAGAALAAQPKRQAADSRRGRVARPPRARRRLGRG